MNIADIVSTIVVMLFVYIIAKHKLLPYLVKRKMEKKLGEVESKVDSLDASSGMIPASFLQYLSQPQPPVSSDTGKSQRLITYFDMRLVGVGKEDDESCILSAVNEMLLELGKRGIAPALGFCKLTDNCLMVYTTYKL